MEQVDSLLAMIDDAMAPLAAAQAAEADELAEVIKARGERGSGRKQLEEKHKRQSRRHHTDEIRFGDKGEITLMAASHNHGQGHQTSFGQIVSGVLGVPPCAGLSLPQACGPSPTSRR